MIKRTAPLMIFRLGEALPRLRCLRRSRVDFGKVTACQKLVEQRRMQMIAAYCCLFVVLATTMVCAADPFQKPMRETASVMADTNVLKRLGTVQDYLADKRWGEAADILHEVAQSEGRSLVLAQPGQAGESAVYLNVATRCQVLLSRMPSEGLAVYRRKFDPQAQRWFENWERTQDASELERIVRQTYLSSVGDNALWSLGELAWDREDFATARHFWTQLIPIPSELRDIPRPTVLRYPDSEFDPAAVLARLVLCSLMEQNRERAIAEQAELKRLYPESTGMLAGQHGRLVDLIEQILTESTTWDDSPSEVEVATYGLSAARTQILPSIIDVGPARWQQPLTSNLLPQPERFRTFSAPGPLSTHPVVFRDLVLVNDAETISAFHLLTGEPAWPNARGTAQIYPPVPEERAAAPERICVGVPWFTMTVAEGKLYARMGSPVTSPSETELRSLACDLVCLDLSDSQGKLVWKLASSDWRGDGQQPWRFEGSPLVKEGRAYVLHSRRRPQMEFAVSCLDAATGERLWNRPLVTARTTMEDHHNRVSHLLPTLGAGKLFVSTDAGAIVAVDARDGRPEWALTYESQPPEDPVELSDQSRQGLVPAMFHEGLVLVAPNDCDRLFCIEADSGRVRWQKNHPRRERWRHLLGVAPNANGGYLIVSGNSLTALDINTGREAWRISPSDSTERGYGRGVLASDVVFWPTRESIMIVETATGQPRRSLPLNTPDTAETGGNVAIAGGMLLIAQSDKLVAYGEYSLLKERLHRDLSAHPDKTDLLFKLAEIEASAGKLDEAAQVLQTALKLNEATGTPPDVSRKLQLSRLQNLLRRAARQRREAGDVDTAIQSLSVAMSIATEPTDRASLLFDLADAELEHQRPRVALEHWQRILEDDRLRTAPRDDATAEIAAIAAISRLIEQHGHGVYASVEPRAAREIAARLKARDMIGLEHALNQFPHSTSATPAWLELAKLQREAGQLHRAGAVYQRLASADAALQQRATALINWAEALESAGYSQAALRVWKQLLRGDVAHATLDSGGQLRRVDELARESLSRRESSDVESTAPPVARYFERSWATKTPEHARVLVPEGDPPSRALACLLKHCPGHVIEGVPHELECVDREAGSVRWRSPCPILPVWSAYAETHLLVGTNEDVSGMRLEDGRLLWRFSLHAEGAAVSRPSVNWQIRDRWVVAIEQQSGVRLIDSLTGKLVWSFRPNGRMQGAWSCGQQQVAVQTLHPASFWTVDLAPLRNVIERPGLSEPLRQLVSDDEVGRLLFVADTRRIESVALQDSSDSWTYRGGMSFAHVDPVIWIQGARLLLTVDGTTLTEVDRANGQVVWSAGLADLPLSEPARQVVAADEAAFAASRGLLRCVSLSDGERLWEQLVGSPAEQWNVRLCGPLIAAWPKSKPDSIVWCDARSGAVVQRMNLTGSPSSVDVIADTGGCLVLADDRVIALRTQDPD